MAILTNSPVSGNYGNVVIGTTSSITFVLVSSSPGGVIVTAINLTGGSQWAIAGVPALPATVAPSISISFTVTVTPTVAGTITAQVLVEYKYLIAGKFLVSASILINLGATGIGTTSLVGVFNPALLGFPPTQVNLTGFLTTLLKNVGTSPFNVLSATFASCIAPPIFDGTGIDDLTSLGVYTGAANSGEQAYTIVVGGAGGIGLATVAAGGFGYANGDQGTISTGSGTAKYQVTSNIAGVVNGIEIIVPGSTYNTASGVTTTATTGSGSGLTLNITQQADTFAWQLNGSALSVQIPITTSPQNLSQGIQIQFADYTGHDLSDEWIVTVTPSEGTEYELLVPPTFPFTLAPGATQPFDVEFDPTTVGYLLDTLYAVTDAGDVACALEGVCLLIIPVAVCLNNELQVVVGGYGANGSAPAPLATEADNYNSDQVGLLIFNGALWESPGMEKTIFRLGFYYENFGVATLTGTLNVFRPQQGADYIDSVPFSITFGTALADESTRYQEVDVVATGEIITMSMARANSAGPVSIIGIIPYFEQRGEKVRES